MVRINPHLLLIFIITGVSAVTDDDAAIARFQQYLRINTAQPTPDYSAAAAFLLSEADAIGLQSQTLEFVPGKPLLLLKLPGRRPSLPAVLLNSHTDVAPVEPHKWTHPPFAAAIDSSNNIHARGSQDMKCVTMQQLEALRRLRSSGFVPERTVYLSFVPDEEIGGGDGAARFAASDEFRDLGVGLVLDEGLASLGEDYRVFYGEWSPWWLTIRAQGAPGHGAKLYDGSALENLLRSMESVRRFRAAQFDLVKAGVKAEGEVVSVNMVYLKAGTPLPTGFVMNLQPSEAEAGFDIRVPPNGDPEALIRRIAEEWAPSSRNMTFEGFVMNLQPSEAEAGFDIRVPPNGDPEALMRRIVEGWAPSSQNMTFEFKQKVPVHDMFGKPAITTVDSSNPWWILLEEAVKKAGGKLSKPEIFPASPDARFFRERGLQAFGFSPMTNTPILLHNHNEFLNVGEYLKGIGIYESIIKEFAGHTEYSKNEETMAEL